MRSLQRRVIPSITRRRGNSVFGQEGQSVTELAIFVPILLLLLLGIADFARLYATRIAIESAAREAADWGAFYPGRWSMIGSPPVYEQTVAEMEHRACTAASHLTGYAGSGGNVDCTNPSFACVLHVPGNAAQPCTAPSDCADRLGSDPSVDACSVEATLTYTFDLIAPSGLVAIPDSFTFSASSVFAVADELAPTE